MPKISRRTLAAGAAWSVPAVAVAAAAPAYAASTTVPPSPEFLWASGCATVGNKKGGCAGLSKSFQVPFALTNPTAEDLVFVVTDGRASTSGSIPTTFNSPGVAGIYTNNGEQIHCNPEVGGCTTCSTVDTANPDAHICLSAGTTTPQNYWLVYNTLGDSSSFIGQITFQWYSQDGCTPVGDPVTATQSKAIAPNNCAEV